MSIPIMIVTGEASGDMHGARLVQAMQAQHSNLAFSGIGGQELAAAGVEMLFDASRLAVVGITEVLSHLGDILAARKALIRRMQVEKPALLILIDYPDFNLLLAAKAKKMGIPIFYYISPQVWAWRSGRV
jgi:lipid-A-disaccharide synthase